MKNDNYFCNYNHPLSSIQKNYLCAMKTADLPQIIIAIDGHSSCGKSTVAKEIAKKLGYIYIDSGAMYRAVTLFALRNGIAANGQVNEQELINRLPEIKIEFRFNAENLRNETILNGENIEEEIRQLPVSQHVSPVATIREVREAMVALQQEMGKNKGIVMDGRDIGTVVFPEAELKIFMTARPEVRAQRRYDELTAKGQQVAFDDILANVIERDRIDSSREVSPLKQADDAVILDNSDITREQQLNWVLQKVDQLISA